MKSAPRSGTAAATTTKTTTKRKRPGLVAAVRDSKILGVRAGTRPHRIIGIWAVVVEGRVFVRSWSLSEGGWYRTFVEDPRGVMAVGGRSHRVRAVRTKSERIKKLIDRAYAEKYNTPWSLKYVRDLCSKKCRDATLELVPV